MEPDREPSPIAVVHPLCEITQPAQPPRRCGKGNPFARLSEPKRAAGFAP